MIISQTLSSITKKIKVTTFYGSYFVRIKMISVFILSFEDECRQDQAPEALTCCLEKLTRLYRLYIEF